MFRRLAPVMIGLLMIAAIACEAATPAAAPTATATAVPTPVPTATPVGVSAPDAAELAEQVRAALEKAGSFHFNMDMKMAVAGQGFALDVPFQFAGDFSAPDSMSGKLTTSVLGFQLDTEFVKIGALSWVKDPQTGEWQESRDDSGFAPFSPQDFLGDEFFSNPNSPVTDLKLVGTETVDNVLTWHYSAVVSAGQLEIEGSDLQFDMYIGVDDMLPRKITMKGEVDLSGAFGESSSQQMPVATGPANFEMVMTVTNYGVPVTIAPPPGF